MKTDAVADTVPAEVIRVVIGNQPCQRRVGLHRIDMGGIVQAGLQQFVAGCRTEYQNFLRLIMNMVGQDRTHIVLVDKGVCVIVLIDGGHFIAVPEYGKLIGRAGWTQQAHAWRIAQRYGIAFDDIDLRD